MKKRFHLIFKNLKQTNTTTIVIIAYIVVFLILLWGFTYDGIIIDIKHDLNLFFIDRFSLYTYAWDELVRPFGSSEVRKNSANLFPYIILNYILKFLFSQNIAQSLYYSLIFLLSYMGFTSFCRLHCNDNRRNILSILLVGLLFIFNMYVYIGLAEGYSSLLYYYLFTPLLLYAITKVFQTGQVVYYMLFGTSVLLFGFTNPPLLVITLCITLFYIIFLLQDYFKTDFYNSCKKIILLCCISLGLLSYQIIPAVIELSSPSTIAAILVEDVRSFHALFTTFLNVWRGFGNYGLHTNSFIFYDYFFRFGAVFLLVPFLIVLSFFSKPSYTTKKLSLYGLVLISIAIPMIVATKQGILSGLYGYFYDTVQFFQMFRGVYKFMSMYWFGFLMIVVAILTGIKGRLYIIYLMGVLSLAGWIIYPFITHNIFDDSRIISQVPYYYYTIKSQLFDKDTDQSRVLLLPRQYFAKYDRGHTSGPAEVLWNKGFIVSQPAPQSDTVNKLFTTLISDLLTGKTESLHHARVKYIVFRKDITLQDSDLNFTSLSIAQLSQLSSLRYVGTYGQLVVFALKEYKSGFFELLGGRIDEISKINPTQYLLRITISSQSTGQQFQFLQGFHHGWKLYPGTGSPVLKQSLWDSAHHTIYNYANAWDIDLFGRDSHYLIQGIKEGWITRDSNGNYRILLTLYFRPQSQFYLGLAVSAFTFLSLLVWLLYERKRKS